MKVVILAGGYGTRLSEETQKIPKPMVEIGGQPMLWHILNIYAAHGFKDFVIACGYKAKVIEDHFAKNPHPDWRVAIVDTGLDTMTGGRLNRLKDVIGQGTFMVTYGDGVGSVDIAQLVEFHRAHGKLATVTAVHPPARFGGLDINGDQVVNFAEKSPAQVGWINGGFFVFEPDVIDYISGDSISLEAGPLSKLANDGELMAYRHDGFWKPMDTLREKNELESLWQSGDAPWKKW
ncbi:MAG: glucose-1-phosphate cytidylyltransferase [Proteobacteria bacterium]|nr:glucose-1-phosphate cytidylyltransferase [Pseudomonadota bacterium]